MDRRVRIIRGWLIVALAIAGALLIDPVLWFGLATILACNPCCPTSTNCASWCNTPPASLSITFADIADNGCGDCASFNQTWVTSLFTELKDFGGNTTSCTWTALEDTICAVSSGAGTVIKGIMTKSGSDVILRGQLDFDTSAAQSTRWGTETLGAPPTDCSGTHVLSTIVANTMTECDPTGSTCTIVI